MGVRTAGAQRHAKATADPIGNGRLPSQRGGCPKPWLRTCSPALKPLWSASEKSDIMELAAWNVSFRQAMRQKHDLTMQLHDEVDRLLNGPIPRNVIINFKHGVGSPTGVFKSTLALQWALMHDPTFTVEGRVAFTINQMLELLRGAGRKQIYLLDERVHDLKRSAELRLQNIAESCRERQICLFMVGVAEESFTISHYWLERFGESDDGALPDKTVYYLVRKTTEQHKGYRGYIWHDVTPLTDKAWKRIHEAYMVLKANHQEQALQQALTGFDYESRAKRISMQEGFREECYTESGKPNRGKIKNFIAKHEPDITNEERRMLYAELAESPEKYL
jgi:hypothetical protein